MRFTTGRKPAHPIAKPMMPLRQARPALSLMITLMLRPASRCARSRNRRALASGSTGSSSTLSGSATLERSTPALACT